MPTCRSQVWASRSCMNVQSPRGMSNTSFSTPWNFPVGLLWWNEMSNCILARAPSSITVWAHDDWPCSFRVASVTVSLPMWKTTG